jgi:hypothetical protein
MTLPVTNACVTLNDQAGGIFDADMTKSDIASKGVAVDSQTWKVA